MRKNLVILVDNPGEALASAARWGSDANDLEIAHCAPGDLSSHLREALDAGDTPTAILFGASLANPLASARVAYQLTPLSQLVFVVTEADPKAANREEELRRRLVLAPRIGNNWTITRAGGNALARIVQESASSTRKRLQLRTTLDRVRIALPVAPPIDGGEYRRLVLADRYFSSILTHASDAIFSTTPEGMVQSWNRGAERMLGHDEQEILGRHVEVLGGPQGEPLIELIDQVKLGAPQVRRETALRRLDGSEIAADLSLAPVRDARGTLLGVSVIARDISDRRRAEAAVHEQKERLRVTLASIGDGVISTDAQGRVEYMNAVAESLTAWPLTQAVGRPLAEVFRIVNETTRRPVDNPVDRVLREGVIVGLANHTVLIAKDAVERPIDDSAAPIRGEDGRLLGVVLIFRDVTEARAAERRLLESEQRFRQLADSMPQMIWSAAPDGLPDYFNERWYQFTGLPKDLAGLSNDFMGLAKDAGGDATGATALHPEDARRCRERWDEAVRTGTPYESQCRFRDHRANAYRWFLVRALPIRDQNGNILRWFGTCTDVDGDKQAGDTARFLAEAAAAVSELLDIESTLRRVARAAIPAFADWSAVDLLDADGRLRRVEATHSDPEKARAISDFANRRADSPDAAHGVSGVVQTGQPELVADVSDALLQTLARDQQHLRLLREANLRSFLCVPLLSKGRLLGALTFATAESGRRYQQSDLAAAQDLARRVAVAVENAALYEALTEADRRKDEFLATLAHELRNPLAPISMGIEVMRMAGNDPATVSEMLATMNSQVRQMVRLIDDLLDVSRITRGKLELRMAPVRLSDIVKSSVEAVKPLMHDAGHRLSIFLPDEPITLQADPARLSQVLSNLLNNAAKYTPPGGDITLSAERCNDELVVTVKDTGIGIPPNLIDAVFEMFTQVDATLERSISGLGIGLTLVKRLVEMHGGSVRGHSQGEGTGSEFVVRLPLVQPTDPRPAELGEGPALQLACRRVLVVDDNRDAADTLTSMLRMMGQEVQTAYDGEEALITAESLRPDVVLMDIGMPKLNGYDAASRIREQPWGQTLTLVALTGWGQQEDRRRSAQAGFDRHLVKPVDINELREILTAHSTG